MEGNLFKLLLFHWPCVFGAWFSCPCLLREPGPGVTVADGETFVCDFQIFLTCQKASDVHAAGL